MVKKQPAKSIAQSVGELVRAAREGAGLRQADAAESCGITQSYWSMIEAGHRPPTLETLEKIARGLGISIRDLVPE
jgi:transcriptional regulator with XRE-family HTH domain